MGALHFKNEFMGLPYDISDPEDISERLFEHSAGQELLEG
jgi:hypothetical protein